MTRRVFPPALLAVKREGVSYIIWKGSIMRSRWPATLAVCLCALALASDTRARGESKKPIVYSKPKGTIIPYYRTTDGKGKIPFYGEYRCQFYQDGQPAAVVRSRCLDNLRRITQYSTIFEIYTRYDRDDYYELYEEMLVEAVKAKQLIWLSSYGKDGVDRVAKFLDRIERRKDGQKLIRSIFAVHLGDEPYLGGRSREQVESEIRYFDERIQTRYPHIQSWFNFAVSTGDIKTWSTGKEDKPYTLLPRGLDIVSIDYYAWHGNGRTWGTRSYAKASQISLDWIGFMIRDRTFAWNQTRRMLEAIDAASPNQDERPMMLYLGNSSYICQQTHPMTVQSQDAFFEAVKDTEWAGLIWWIFEDYKDCVGGTRPDLLESHERHGRRIRRERLY